MDDKEFKAEEFKELLEGLSKAFENDLQNNYSDVAIEFMDKMLLHTHSSADPIVILKKYSTAAKSVSYNAQNKMWMTLRMMLRDFDDKILTEQNKFFLRKIRNLELSGLVRDYIEVNEGWPMSGDKESFIIGRISKGIIENVDDIDFDSSYADSGRPDMDDDGKKPYWCPETLSNVKELYELLLAYEQSERTFLKREVLEKLKETVGKV